MFKGFGYHVTGGGGNTDAIRLFCHFPVVPTARAMSTHVDRVLAHLRSHYRLKYSSGPGVGINRRAFPLPIFQSFMEANREHGYPYVRQRRRDGTFPPAGQKNMYWGDFHDTWLPTALRRMRAEDEGKEFEDIPETEYDVKVVRNGDMIVYQTRSLKGWEVAEVVCEDEPDAPEPMHPTEAANVLCAFSKAAGRAGAALPLGRRRMQPPQLEERVHITAQ